ncbi:hypothetical protein C9J85_08755 [Haloferax sp. wsp5]|nr:hypothetical protein C9J85_08755 [Haloferax sp. wsp5]
MSPSRPGWRRTGVGNGVRPRPVETLASKYSSSMVEVSSDGSDCERFCSWLRAMNGIVHPLSVRETARRSRADR